MIPVTGVTIPANLDLDQVTNCNRKTYRGVVTIPALDPDLELDFPPFVNSGSGFGSSKS